MTPLYPIQQPPAIPNTSGIYCITCNTNGKIYIGSSIDLRKRLYEHSNGLVRNNHDNPNLQNAWNKYGSDAFTFEILELVLVPFLLEREQYWIDKLKAVKKGFNICPTAGSVLGRKQPPEAIEKTRQAHLGRKRPPETGQRISAAKVGKPSPHKGKKQRPEVVEQRSIRMTGYKHTEETKLNMAKAQTGRVHSLESRQKRSQSLMGHTVSPETGAKIAAANRGRKASEETRAKQSAASAGRKRTHEEYASRRKTLILTDPNGIEYMVTGIYDFCQEHGLDSSAINKVVKGRYAHHRGWTARYPDADIS